MWPRALRLGGGGCQLTYGALARYGGQLLLGGDQALVLVLQARGLLVQPLALRLGLDQLVLRSSRWGGGVGLTLARAYA